MKAVILAGGLGTRLSEETVLKPKPMIEIGGMPVLWHIMKIYSYYGINEFIVCLGYKGYTIKEYFANYFMHNSDITYDIQNNTAKVHQNYSDPWKVTLVNTGLNTMTGGRIKRIKSYLPEEDFCLTYGDGVGNININELIEFHKAQKTICTVTAVQPKGRFGALNIESHNRVSGFQEKPQGDGGWINGGFFIMSNKVIDYIQDDSTIWEQEPLINLANDNQLSAFHHNGFWQPMDTLRDKRYLESLWEEKKAPWKVW